MSDLALAVGAGLLAAVNPCGFALLPVYLTVLVLGDDSPSRLVAVRRAGTATVAMTAGFVTVFGVVGLALTPVIGTVHTLLPWFTAGFGVFVAGLGAWVVAGRSLPSFVRPLSRGPAVRRTAGSMVLFGMAYALSSLSCTVAPFLTIVVSSFRSGAPLAGAGLFVAYAAGMGLLVGVAALGVAVSRPYAVTGLRRHSSLIARAAGAVLVCAGMYVAYYGILEARGVTDDPVLDTAQALQRPLAGFVEHIGAPALTVALGILLLGTLLAAAHRTRRASQRSSDPHRRSITTEDADTS